MAVLSSTSPRVRADVFPAVLTVAPPGDYQASSFNPIPDESGAQRLDKVRVIVTLERVLVFQDSASGPELIFSEALLDYTPPPKRGQTIRTVNLPREAVLTTESGKTLAFHRAGGCGCGSRLKGFNPFSASTTYASANDVV